MSGSKIHVWLDETSEHGDMLELSAKIESPEGNHRVRYRINRAYKEWLTPSADPFVLASLFCAMRNDSDLVVHGSVSPTLLRNLAEFQAAWACWKPDVLKEVEIIADIEREADPPEKRGATIAAFTGGVDSCFTVHRHMTGNACPERLKKRIDAAMMVQGFDIPLDDTDAFQRASMKAERTLESYGIKLITMSSNYKVLNKYWDDTHGCGLASCLMLLQNKYEFALLASGRHYSNLRLPWGSNPASDHLLANKFFQIIHDGAAYSRSEKIREIRNWPQAMENLRVCFSATEKDKNCSQCMKCIGTVLHFRVQGVAEPPSFIREVLDSDILSVRLYHQNGLVTYGSILAAAREAGIHASWVDALDKMLKYNRCRLELMNLNTSNWRDQLTKLYLTLKMRGGP